MIKKFHDAYDAGTYAVGKATQWVDDAGRRCNASQVLGYLTVADESNPTDHEDLETYYFVTDNGDIGFTQDDGVTVVWVFRRADARGNAQREPERPQPIPAPGQRPAPRRKGRVGYSPNINSAEFQRAVSKGKKSNNGCAAFFIIAPVVILPIYLHFTDDAFFTGLCIGVVVSVVLLIIYLFTKVKEKTEKPWEGVVVSKEQKQERRKNQIGTNNRNRDHRYWEYHDIVTIRRDDGKTHVLNENAEDTNSRGNYYLQVGDRVRFLAGMGLLWPYEKFDKSLDDTVVCHFCRHIVPIRETHCTRCHNILLN